MPQVQPARCGARRGIAGLQILENDFDVVLEDYMSSLGHERVDAKTETLLALDLNTYKYRQFTPRSIKSSSLHTSPLSCSPSHPYSDKSVSPDARQSPLLPMEVLLIVFGMLRDVSDESAAAIFHRKAERRRLMQVCPTFAAACRGTPSLWSDIVVQLPELGRLFHTTEYSIQNQLHLSRNRPLRIVFDAPFTTAPDSERHKIWEMLKATTVRVRWHALYFVGHRHCEGGYSCPHAVFTDLDSNILLTTQSLRTFSLTFENPGQRCGAFHAPGEDEVHHRAVRRAGVDQGGTVGGGEPHDDDLPHQPVGNGVLVSSDTSTALQKDPEERCFVAVDELHVKVVKVGVDLGVDVEGLDLRAVHGVAAAGGKCNLEVHKTSARLES
ncbi:hypothetical protein B0H13DRAFT_1922013 [Mycena leptocephala]|nr:hypothetical protein B0H13DRAFT_1922013 [Mycena leptocephala]